MVFGGMQMSKYKLIDILVMISKGELKDFFLGKDWYVVAPMHQEQINFNIVCEIETKLSKFKMN